MLSCAPKPKILPQNRTPENVLRCARENQIEFKSLACLLDLQLKGKEAKYSGSVEFYFQAPDTFAFYPRSFLGINIFKAIGEGDSLTIYFPKENQYFTGNYSDLENTSLWSWKIPFRMLLDLISGKVGLMEPNVQYVSNTDNLFVYRYEDENWIKEHYVDAGRYRLTKSRLTQKANGDYYQIEYKNYSEYDDQEMPQVVKIVSSSQDIVSIKFWERKFDLKIPETKFKLQIPSDSKRVELKRQEK